MSAGRAKNLFLTPRQHYSDTYMTDIIQLTIISCPFSIKSSFLKVIYLADLALDRVLYIN